MTREANTVLIAFITCSRCTPHGSVLAPLVERWGVVRVASLRSCQQNISESRITTKHLDEAISLERAAAAVVCSILLWYTDTYNRK